MNSFGLKTGRVAGQTSFVDRNRSYLFICNNTRLMTSAIHLAALISFYSALL